MCSDKKRQNNNYKHLIFDFDGVIAETNSIRFEGFRLLFEKHDKDKVSQIVDYAKQNGGISRYHKIRYFYEKLLSRPITDEEVQGLAVQYSGFVKKKIIEAPFVKGSMEFLIQHEHKYDFAIASGSDQEELREVCLARKINSFFVEILGSPLTKEENLSRLLSDKKWEKESCLYVGDTRNDLDAARSVGIDFIGRQSGLVDWQSEKDIIFIDDLTQLHLHLL